MANKPLKYWDVKQEPIRLKPLPKFNVPINFYEQMPVHVSTPKLPARPKRMPMWLWILPVLLIALGALAALALNIPFTI